MHVAPRHLKIAATEGLEQMKRPGECKMARPAPGPWPVAGKPFCERLVSAWLLTSCLCLVLLQFVLDAAALSPDGLALLDFKRHVVDESGYLSSWNEGDDTPCEWAGVTCGQDASSVSNLHLHPLSLGGTLSSSLGDLANLTYLDLTNNSLSGPIPPEILNAKLLTVLNLGNNALNGSIPGNISQLRSLTRLDLSRNYLSGSIPGLNGFAHLVWLDLSNNRLGGPFPNVELLKNLEYVDLSSNKFTAEPGSPEAPNLADLQGLREIRMSGCQLEGPLPSGIAGMPNLTWLDLSSNHLSGAIPVGAWGSKTLDTVDLSNNWLTGSIPRQLLEQLHGQGRLNLSSNHLSGSIPDALSASAVLGLKVDLSHNHLEGPIPSTFGSASLDELHLQDNHLSGDITSIWSSASSWRSDLTALQLQGNGLGGEIGPATCKNWEKMQHLDLSGNPIRLVNDSLSIMLGTFADLRELRLSNIGSSGKLPGRLRHRKRDFRLQSLDLSNSRLEGDLAASLLAEANLLYRRLEFLDLSDNGLTGQVPFNFTRLPDLRVLGLANNHLSGRLPPLPRRLLQAPFFAGNPGLCGPPLEECRSLWYQTLVFRLVAALGACVLVSAAGCFSLAWRVRVYSERHRQDADLIAALQGKDSANLMPLADLRKATSNFAEGSQIGVGGFGTVYKGSLSDGTPVAIKKSRRQKCQQDKDQFLNEVRILSRVNHRNLVRLLGCCLANKTALLVFEYVPNGTLQEHLRARGPGENAPLNCKLTWKQRLRIALDTADALAYLHSYANPPIFHRDVKSANILLDEDMNAKVADFGISKLAPLDATHVSTVAVQGTIGYIDPEYYTSFQLSAKSDVYSFGVVLLELISGQAPVDFRRGVEHVGHAALTSLAVPLIRSGEVQEIIDPAISEAFTSSDSATGKESIVAVATLAVRCLKSRSKDRPSMKEVSKELQTLWLVFDPTPGSHEGDQILESQVISSSLQLIPEDGFNSLLSSSSFPQGSGVASYIQMEDISKY